jgi:hypothetical protein
MGATRCGRSFNYLALSLLIQGFVTGGVNSLARARDSVAAIEGPGELTPVARPVCDAAALAGCQTTSQSQNTGKGAVPGRVSEPRVTRVRTNGSDPSPLFHIQLRLQRDLFTRGGRLAPIDVLVDTAVATAPTERTEKVPAWATKLRAARAENEKRGS